MDIESSPVFCDIHRSAHYLTDTWLLESRVLRTFVMHESHTALNVNAMFDSATQIDNLAHISCFAPYSQPTEANYGVTIAWEDQANNWFSPQHHTEKY